MPATRSPNLHPLAVSPDTAAELLGIGRTKLYELLDAGRIASLKVDRRRIIPMKALEAFLGGECA